MAGLVLLSARQKELPDLLSKEVTGLLQKRKIPVTGHQRFLSIEKPCGNRYFILSLRRRPEKNSRIYLSNQKWETGSTCSIGF